jgi:uncharacterized repeat protein (TIGR03803 family)
MASKLRSLVGKRSGKKRDSQRTQSRRWYRPSFEQLESRLAPSFTLSALASFNGANGSGPSAGLIMDQSGNLYGTTSAGGANADGTVFELTRGSTIITTLASFNGTNGAFPHSGLIMDQNGNFYGTTRDGGASGKGTVFELASGSSTITTLASFNVTNGADPRAGLIMDSGGNLYGTASSNGPNNAGTVFELASGSSTITTLASFNVTNGNVPSGDLIMDSAGNLYGTTQNGGANADGVVFELAKGSSTITALASFTGANGIDPFGGLIMDPSGNLYGTTQNGGANADGVVFELAKGSRTITALASFNGANGSGPFAGLIMDPSGNLYGTTNIGATSGVGCVFELASGSGTIVALASFNNTNGANPTCPLIMDQSGNLYGTAINAGAFGGGTVFELTGLPHPVTHFLLTAPASATAGTPVTVTATAADSSGNPVPGYTGTIHFTSSDTQANLPADYTFIAGDAGQHSFTVSFLTTGNQSLTVTDKGTPSITGTATITVLNQPPGPTVQFATASETVNENTTDHESAFSVTVTLSAVSSTDTTIPFTVGGTAEPSTDYSGITASPLVIAAGQTTGTITGTLIDDGSPDAIKTLAFTLGTPTNATLGSIIMNTLTIGEEPPLLATAVAVNGFEQSCLNEVTVATFTVGDGTEPPTDFSATIDWGDGNTSAATVTRPETTYTVQGSHTYTDERTYPISVVITGAGATATVGTTGRILEELLPDGTRGTPNQRFISEVYRDLLRRKVDLGGLAYWSGLLDAGMNTNQVAIAIENDPGNEFRTIEVQDLYSQYLHRAADPLGLNGGIGFLRSGGTVEQLASFLAGSDEYFRNRGSSSNQSWEDAIIQDALNRPINSADRAAMDAAFAQGMSRAEVTATVPLSYQEYRQDLVESIYMRYLDRNVDPVGMNNDLNALNLGWTDERVIAGTIGEPVLNEFFNKTAP